MGRTAASTTSSGPRSSARRRAAVLRRLDADWDALVADPEAGRACRRWAGAAVELAGCADPDEVLRRVPAAPDPVLRHLLARCAAGETLAGRVVVQALLPKLVRMAAVDPGADVDDYLTALWCEIATYPLARRPTSLAANLVLDTLKAVRRERPAPVDAVTAPEVVLAAADRRPARLVGARPAGGGPSLGGVLRRAREHRLVDARTGDVLRSVYVERLSGASAAARHGLTPGAVRTRCSRAVQVLALHADLLLD